MRFWVLQNTKKGKISSLFLCKMTRISWYLVDFSKFPLMIVTECMVIPSTIFSLQSFDSLEPILILSQNCQQVLKSLRLTLIQSDIFS